MKIITSLITAAGLATLAACGGAEEEANMANDANMMTADEFGMDNMATDMNMDLNATDMNATDMNMDMNADMNMDANAADTTTDTY